MTCRTCSLRSKQAILEVATYNLQKWRGLAQSWVPCMPIWHPLNSSYETISYWQIRYMFRKNEFIYKQSESKLHWRCQFHAQVRGQLWYEVITSVENGLWVPSTPPLDWANLAQSVALGLARACYNIYTTGLNYSIWFSSRFGFQVEHFNCFLILIINRVVPHDSKPNDCKLLVFQRWIFLWIVSIYIYWKRKTNQPIVSLKEY